MGGAGHQPGGMRQDFSRTMDKVGLVQLLLVAPICGHGWCDVDHSLWHCPSLAGVRQQLEGERLQSWLSQSPTSAWQLLKGWCPPPPHTSRDKFGGADHVKTRNRQDGAGGSVKSYFDGWIFLDGSYFPSSDGGELTSAGWAAVAWMRPHMLSKHR